MNPSVTYVEIPKKHRFIYEQNGKPPFWNWCEHQFGPPNNSDYGKPPTEFYWGLTGSTTAMYFKDPHQALMFRLAWS